MTTKKVDDLTTDELNEQVALCQGWEKAVDVCCDAQIMKCFVKSVKGETVEI